MERKKGRETEREIREKSDRTKIPRLYWKYLLADSYRKAPVYQKKYLLLSLWGFQDCEQTNLL